MCLSGSQLRTPRSPPWNPRLCDSDDSRSLRTAETTGPTENPQRGDRATHSWAILSCPVSNLALPRGHLGHQASSPSRPPWATTLFPLASPLNTSFLLHSNLRRLIFRVCLEIKPRASRRLGNDFTPARPSPSGSSPRVLLFRLLDSQLSTVYHWVGSG